MKNDIKAYLKRIGIEPDTKIKANLATLQLLQKQHLKTVPYENLDIMRDIPLSMNTSDIFEKIVSRGRGGYCFELNGLFAWLLKELGYPVVEFMGRFLRGETEIPQRRHRVLKVTCPEGDYLSDVGVGQIIPLAPLPMVVGQICDDITGRYKLEKDSFLGWVLCERKKGEWKWVYSFTEEPQLNIDYIMPSYYCESHPESYFRTMDMVHIYTETGRKVVAGRELKIFPEFSSKGVEVMVPGSEKIYHELLETHFGIKLS